MQSCAVTRDSADPFRAASALRSILAAGRDDEQLDDDLDDDLDEDEDNETDATLIRVPGMDEELEDDPGEHPHDDDDAPADRD